MFKFNLTASANDRGNATTIFTMVNAKDQSLRYAIANTSSLGRKRVQDWLKRELANGYVPVTIALDYDGEEPHYYPAPKTAAVHYLTEDGLPVDLEPMELLNEVLSEKREFRFWCNDGTVLTLPQDTQTIGNAEYLSKTLKNFLEVNPQLHFDTIGITYPLENNDVLYECDPEEAEEARQSLCDPNDYRRYQYGPDNKVFRLRDIPEQFRK